MKKTILFFILITGTVFGQEKAVTESGKTVILKNDHTWEFEMNEFSGLKSDYFKSENNHILVGIINKIQIFVKNGEDKNVPVYFEFISTTDQFSSISIDKVEKMINYSRDYLLLDLKNKYSFIPRKIKMSYSDSRRAWMIMWDYTANNSYGGQVEGNKIILYDNDVKRIEI